MKFEISLDGSFMSLNKEDVLFSGYINRDGALLYDCLARDKILEHLRGNSIASLFDKINGAFRFIYYTDGVLYFSIDHFGGYSLFYKILDDKIQIFDNPMSFDHKSRLNDGALCSILASGFTQAQDTIFEEVFECTPGILYKYYLTTGKLEQKTWFRYISTGKKTFSNKEFIAILDRLFPETDAGKYALSLSGGIDSRLLLCCLLQQKREFRTYSFGSELNQDKHIAESLSAHFKIKHATHDFTPEICAKYYSAQDIDFILNKCTLGRSLPNETDLISSCSLNPETDIICKGFGGDWAAGRYITPELIKQKNQSSLTKYLFQKYFNLTCISSDSFRKLIGSQFSTLMSAYILLHPHSMISAAEEWNLHHYERKYIVNTLSFYKAKGFKFYLPFYDRSLMNYFSKLRFADKINQEAYFTFISKHYFIGKMAEVKEISTLYKNFLTPNSVSPAKRLSDMALRWLRTVDRKKIRKRYAPPSLMEFADSLMLFNKNFEVYPYLRNKIHDNFPEANTVADFLRQNGCPQAAKHIDWMARQKTSQINVNGLSLCNFFFNRQFIESLKKRLASPLLTYPADAPHPPE